MKKTITIRSFAKVNLSLDVGAPRADGMHPVDTVMQLIGIGVFVCCVPLIILYTFTQKTFVQSLTMTGSKE